MPVLSAYGYSVLSVDSYYDRQGLDVIGAGGQAITSELTEAHGLTAIYRQSDSNGFSATCYRTADNKFIISYRGTDGISDIDDDLDIPLTVPGQFSTAIEFYNVVNAYINDPVNSISNAEIFLTGHSLGGGLASIVSAVTNKEAIVFDPAPSVVAITGLKSKGFYENDEGDEVPVTVNEGFQDIISGYRIDGSFLTDLPESSMSGSLETFDLGEIDESYGSVSSGNLHSSNLIALLMSKSDGGGSYAFIELAKDIPQFIPALFDSQLIMLATGDDGDEFEDDEYRKKLIYAGEAYIDALYDDISLLASLDLESLNVASDNEEAFRSLLRLAVQHSRLLVDTDESFAEARTIFSTDGKTISVDLSAFPNLDQIQNDKEDIVGKQYIAQEFFKDPIRALGAGHFGTDHHTPLFQQLEAVQNNLDDPSSHETLIVESNGAGGIEINGTDAGEGVEGSDLIVGGVGDDTINGLAGGDFINGMSGHDDISGGAGDDVILGGDGSDFIYGDEGADIVFGGRGNDYLFDQFGGDTLDGGAGDDLLIAVKDVHGPTGADIDGSDYSETAGTTFIFGKGYGTDVIDVTGMDLSEIKPGPQYAAGHFNNT